MQPLSTGNDPTQPIAIDAVLLPDATMTRRAIDIAATSGLVFSSAFSLNPLDCLPHISLAMGVIKRASLKAVARALLTIAAGYRIFDLTAGTVRRTDITPTETVLDLPVEKQPSLQRLHESILQELSPFFLETVTAEAIAPPPPVNDFTVNWIKNYRHHSSGGRFDPHITLGFAPARSISHPTTPPMRFTAATLALCHLGNWCTCRYLLAAATLSLH